MKTATLTFHRALNYGAVLQAYALQKAIEDLGHDNTIIDYRCKAIENFYKPVRFYKFRNPIAYLKYRKNYKKNSEKRKKFEEFIMSYLKITPKPYKTQNSLLELNNLYDKFICGSDQVWNHNITKNDFSYLLEFVYDMKKKYSYAASFGFEEVKSELLLDYRNLLNEFNMISVRERKGQNIVKKLITADCPVVLDPTLLLSNTEWKKVAGCDLKFKNYILLYILMETETIFSFVNYLSKAIGLQIIYINMSEEKPGMINLRNIGPTEWLSLIMNADYIVTNSYHGTIFSLNLNKNFFVELLPSYIGVNERFETIFDTFCLHDRQIIEGQNENIFKPIDYSRINNIIEQEREMSMTFLRRIVDDKNE
ncbi:MAG: polysaccharide pyruvyl transferase family protein [Bacillota bacterium]|nr:polysaccharide pyruvyl transferase family protein [Bacillota bacterium]